MNENFIITLVQGINTAIMNLLVLLLFIKIYKPKYDGKKVYVFSYIVTTILYVACKNRYSYYKFDLYVDLY